MQESFNSRKNIDHSLINMASRICLVNEKIRCKLFNIPFRASIFKVHLERIKTEMDKEAIAKKMASLTSGFSGVCEICYSLYEFI